MTSIAKKRDSRNSATKTISRKKAISSYVQLIKNRIKHPIIKYKKGETELHHILPRGVMNNHPLAEIESNKVRLYSREHLLAHYFLSVIFPDNIKVQTAYYLMAKGNKDVKSIRCMSIAYQKSKERIVKHRTGKTYNELFGTTKSEQIKRKQKEAKLQKSIRFIVDNNS